VSETYTQWICTTQPLCLCSGGVEDDGECCCLEDGLTPRCCSVCNATMKLIDFETGEDAVS
jgi:hypothetical protein